MSIHHLGFGIRDVGFVLAMGTPPSGGNPLLGLLPAVFILVIFFVIVVLPMRRNQKKVQDFLSALKVGDRVVTSGGIFGTITKVGDDSLQLQIANNVRVEVAR